MRDTRYIPPPQTIPLCHIHINECNPEEDIACTQYTIQTQYDTADIYDNTGRHLITIPETRLKWLWDQYHLALNRPHNLGPPTQPFETKVACLYQRYKYKTPKNDPLKLSQYTLPNTILENFINTFQIIHSYFSSPVTCFIKLRQFHSPFPRDVVFGSVGKAFHHKWHGNGYAHPHTNTETQQTLHWARLAAKNDSNSITMLVMPDKNWYHNRNPHNGPFSYSHVITHFKADTIIYEEPTIPP